MKVLTTDTYWKVSIEIPLWIFEEWKNLITLQFDENCSNLIESKGGTIWVIYQDQYTLQLASEYYLKNHKNKDKKNLFDSMRRMFMAEAHMVYGCLIFDFNTKCGIDGKELKRGVCFIEEVFVKIGLRN